MTLRFRVLICSLTLPLIVATAQTPARKAPMPASAHKLAAIKVSGSNRFTLEEIASASGLKMGESVGEDDFKQAAEHLGETGAFTDVGYSFNYSPQGTKVELKVTESDKFVPVSFENFVWCSDQELLNKLHHYVPLFKGELPAAGSLADSVADALQALLVERGIKGQADYIRTEGGNGSTDSIQYTVSGLNIRVGSVEIAGAGAAEAPLLAAAAEGLRGKEYLRSKVSAFANSNLVPVYLERGYLKARFAAPEARVVREDSQETEADVTLRVSSGQQYKVGKIDWVGNRVYPKEKLEPLVGLKPGDLANAVQLQSGVEAARKLYHTRGYMGFAVTPAPHFDDASASVSYELEVHEGEVYRMGELDIRGLDTRLSERLSEAWKLKEGDPYDGSYPKRFLTDTSGLMPANLDFGVSVREGVNERDKTVDVTLRFTIKGAG